MTKDRAVWVSGLALLVATGCGGGSSGSGTTKPVTLTSTIDIRADVNRNGQIDMSDPTEDDQEETWDASHGAIFLANMDDDSQRCPKDSDIASLSDAELAGCYDGADEVVNGDDDLADMARLQVAAWPDAPDTSNATVTVTLGTDDVRLFKNNGGSWDKLPADGALTPAELRAGVELAIEGKDIVRDSAVWDGFVEVTLHVDGGKVPKGKPGAGKAYPSGDDKVRMRIAPLMLSHHLQPAQQIYATKVAFSAGNSDMLTDLGDAVTQAGVPEGLVETTPSDPDQWTQDWMEIGWMTMPAANGAQHQIDVYMRSVNVQAPNDKSQPLRPAGRYVYANPAFHGKDVAGLTPSYDLNHDGSSDSLNSYGDTETTPPYEYNGKKYPMGRVFRGETASFGPDPLAQKMLVSQGYQPLLTVDTSWLLVGHVDETITFLKMKNDRGWGLGVNDAALAKKMLEDLVAAGNGDVPFFSGKQLYDDTGKAFDATTSAAQILANTDVMGESADAIVQVDGQIQVFKDEVGITDADLVSIPYLHWKAYGYSVAYQPGTANGIYLSDTDYGAPATHGPVINGKDPFATQLEDAMGAHGIKVHWIEDWDLYHSLEGEVHCGSNTKRALPTTKWWEAQL